MTIEPTAEGLAGALGPGLDPGDEIAPKIAGARTPFGAWKLSRAAWAWALYEGGRDPYVILITIYIFGPYFANVAVGDPIRGQALLADIGTIYGLIAAVTGPLLGAAVDRLGRRKPLLLGTNILLLPLIVALWWVKPAGQGGMPIMTAAVIFGAIGVLFAYNEVLHNSLLARAATPQTAPQTSGLAYSLANAVSVLSLSFVLWAFALPGKVHWGFVPSHPLFGLDPVSHQPDRIVAPIAAALMAVGAVPLFFLTPDAPATGAKVSEAFRHALSSLAATLRSLKGHRDAAIYLGARMLYTDAKTALLLFGGVYAAGVMHWGVLEMLAYGILLSIFAVFGGFVGAWLDRRVGPKLAIQIEVMGSFACLAATMGMRRDQILYLLPYPPAAHAPLWNGPMFQTLPEVLYLTIGFGTAIFVTAAYGSSRTFLTRLAPPGQSAAFFGLYALSGAVTMWLGSLLVRLFTQGFHSQQAGFIPIAGLLLLGFIGMGFVRDPSRTGRPAD